MFSASTMEGQVMASGSEEPATRSRTSAFDSESDDNTVWIDCTWLKSAMCLA
jgi:hypothetical protein